jgi:hypothetical protein
VKEIAMPLPRLPALSFKLYAGIGALLLVGTALPVWLLVQLHGLTAGGGHRLSLADWGGLRNAVLLMLGAETALAIVLTRALLRHIGGPLREAAEAARRVAVGDLSGRPGAGAGALMGCMQAMNDKLTDTIVALRGTADRIAGGAGEIACGSMELGARQAAGAAQLAALLGEAAGASATQGSGIEQLRRAMTALERGTADNAALAEQLAATALQLGEETAQLNRVLAAFVLGPEHARPPARIKLIASNPGKLGGRGKARGRIAPVPADPQAAHRLATAKGAIDSKAF